MQAFTLTFKPATDTLPDRWIAKAAGAVCPKTYALWRFLARKGWSGAWVIGQASSGHYVAVCYGDSMDVFGQAGRIYVKNS